MRQRHLGFVAAAATLLAAAPLSTIYESWTWLIQCAVAVGLIAGAATLTRVLRWPVWAQLLGMAATLLMVLTLMFPSGRELLAVVPTPSTFTHFGAMMNFAVEDMRSYGVPVPDRPGLQFITVLGVGSVAILVDVLTVAMRRPALAGLPMLAIYSVPVAVYTTSVHPLPFVIGAAGFLWLLVADNVDRVRRFGRRFTGDGRDVDVWEPSPLAAAGRRLAVVGVALAVLLPLAVPGMTTGLLATFGTGPGVGQGNGPAGAPGKVDLFAKLSGELQQGPTTDLLTVKTNDPEPFYLRFGVADQLTPEGFGGRTPNGRTVQSGLADYPRDPVPGVTYNRYQASVEITDGFDMPMLPVYSTPVEVRELDNRWRYDANMGIVYANRARSKGEKYEFEYVRAKYSTRALRGANALPDDSQIRKQYTALPEPEVQLVKERAAELTKSEPTEYDKVLAIYESFAKDNGFTYDTQTTTGTSGVAIVDFLTNKKGFCQQYAAAMAWLVRAAGIPARVAFGFTNGSGRSGDTVTLTNKNLHAWTEVYFGDGIGWVPFDATPAASVAGSARSSWAPDVDAVEEAEATPGATAGAAADPSAGPTGAAENLGDSADLGAGPGEITPTSSRWPWFTIAGAVLLLVLLCVPAMRRRALRRRRQAGASTSSGAGPSVVAASPGVIVTDVAVAGRAREDAHAAWAELIDTMVDFRVPIDLAETPRATADRLATAGLVDGPAAEGARLLGQAEERARYARNPLQAGRLGDGLRAVRRALAARAGRRTRLAAAILPPSVLLRWRQAIVDRSVRTVATSGRLRDVMLRWSPRRLLTRSR